MTEQKGTMVLRVARKEIIEMFRDGRFRAAGAIVSTLLAASLVLGWQYHREIEQQHGAARQATREQWLGQGKKNPHSAAHYGVHAFKPAGPLTLVDRGTDTHTGVAVWLEAHKQNEFKYRPVQDATAIQRFGELTGATVLQLFVPLLIILLTFNSFAGERESGTLRLLLSQGVSRASLAGGKALGAAAALSILLVPAAIAGALAITVASGPQEMAAAVPRMTWMAAGYLLYFAAFTGLSLAVSAASRSPRRALMVLMGFWIFNGLVAPRAASDLSKRLFPAPSAFAFGHAIELQLEGSGHDASGERIKRLEERLLKQYGVTSIAALPVNFNGIRLQEGEEHGNTVFDHAYGELWATFSRQDAVHRALAVVAPSLAIRSVSMGFAGADRDQHVHFAQAAEHYRRMIQRVMNGDLAKNASNSGIYMADAGLWQKVPPFEYTAPGAAWVLERQAPSLAILGLWSIAAAVATVHFARRMEAD